MDVDKIEFRSDVTVDIVRSSAHDSDVLFAARVSTKGEQSLEDVEGDALMNFLSLRTKRDDSAFPSYPQREIEMVAEKMEAEWAKLMPVTYAAFNENGRVAP